MAEQRIMVFVGEAEAQKRQQAAALVTKVLAEYPHGLLAEASEGQVAALKQVGFEVEIQKDATMIKLRAVEFDTAAPFPEAPEAMSLHEVDLSGEKVKVWIVQFVGPVKPEWTEAVGAAGVVLLEYIPENAFLVRMNGLQEEQVAGLEFVSWVGIYEPAYKVSPLLMGMHGKIPMEALSMTAIDTATHRPNPLGNLTIHLVQGKDRSKVVKKVEKLGGVVIIAEKTALRVSLDPVHVEEIANLDGVKWIEPFVMPKLSNDVAAQILHVEQVWNSYGLDGSGQVVAVADTGLDSGLNDGTMHDDFEARIEAIHSWPIPSGLQPYLDNTSWDDGAADMESGHGTHVAGSVLGNGARSGGTIRGMAPNARLAFQAVEQYLNVKPAYQGDLPDGYYLVGIPGNLNTLFQQTYNDGARIFSNSWGSTQDNAGNQVYGQYTVESQEIDEFIWNHKDALILFAASNDGNDGNADGVIDLDSLSVQASAKNCITVGASENNRPHGSTPPPGYDIQWGTGSWAAHYPVAPIRTDHVSNNPEGMAAFSSRGPTDDGRIKPDLVAPGTNILSTRSSRASENGWGLLPAGNPQRDYYMYMGGTSMSTPIAAGAVALVRQYIQQVRQHANPSAALLKALLVHGATGMTGQYNPPEVNPPPDNVQGWGRLNLENTLFPAPPAVLEFRDNPADAVGAGEVREYSFTVSSSSLPLRATLVWSDYPSSPVAGGLYNSLRLSVLDPASSSLQGAPTNNNVQQVSLINPQPGEYKVRVTGLNVPTAALPGVSQKQDFALVVTCGTQFVDVYIKDNPADTGVSPTVGVQYNSPDIWVSLANDPATAPADSPEYGQTNYVFVRVHNRGTLPANGAQVNLYWTDPGTNLTRPYWQTSGISVNGTPGNVQVLDVPAAGAGSDGEAVCGFEWLPPEPGTGTHQPGHFCLFASVDHPADPLMQEEVTAVRWEDNLAWKNLIVKDVVPNTTVSSRFYAAGVFGKSLTGSLHFDRRGLPQGTSVRIKLPSRLLKNARLVGLKKVWQSPFNLSSRLAITAETDAAIEGIRFKSRDKALILVEVDIPQAAAEGANLGMRIEQRMEEQISGAVTLNFNVKA
jgi:subtilisin family serine protease